MAEVDQLQTSIQTKETITTETTTQDCVKIEPTKNVKTSSFSIPIIIAAALVFIVIIAWFECLRIWLEFAFNSTSTVIFNKALGDTVYAVVATSISILIIFLLVRFWIKS